MQALIPPDTVSSFRLILAGTRLRNNYVASSAVVHLFDTVQGISNALVSKHS